MFKQMIKPSPKVDHLSLLFHCLVLGVLLLGGCRKEDSTDDSGDDALLEWHIGKNNYTVPVGDTLREFIVYVPGNYAPDQPAPLVFMLHGSSGTGEKFYRISGWTAVADRVGCVVVFPTALDYPIVSKQRRITRWTEAELADDLPPGYPIVDDVPFFEEMIRRIVRSMHIDTTRIYVSGFSNGGRFVANRLLPEMNNRFAACAGWGIGFNAPTAIVGRIPPYFQIVGTDDQRLKEGLMLDESLPYHSLEALLQYDALRERIQYMTMSLGLTDRYTEHARLPAFNRIRWAEARSAHASEATLFIVDGLAHEYANGRNNPHGIDAAEVLWRWFSTHQLPQ